MWFTPVRNTGEESVESFQSQVGVLTSRTFGEGVIPALPATNFSDRWIFPWVEDRGLRCPSDAVSAFLRYLRRTFLKNREVLACVVGGCVRFGRSCDGGFHSACQGLQLGEE